MKWHEYRQYARNSAENQSGQCPGIHMDMEETKFKIKNQEETMWLMMEVRLKDIVGETILEIMLKCKCTCSQQYRW